MRNWLLRIPKIVWETTWAPKSVKSNCNSTIIDYGNPEIQKIKKEEDDKLVDQEWHSTYEGDVKDILSICLSF